MIYESNFNFLEPKDKRRPEARPRTEAEAEEKAEEQEIGETALSTRLGRRLQRAEETNVTLAPESIRAVADTPFTSTCCVINSEGCKRAGEELGGLTNEALS